MKDIAIENSDIVIKYGDFVISESDSQDVSLILNSIPGDWVNDSVIGVDISQFINDESDFLTIYNTIKRHLNRDSKSLDNFNINSEGIIEITLK